MRLVALLTAVPLWALTRTPAAERRWLVLVAAFVALDLFLLGLAGVTLAGDSPSVLIKATAALLAMLIGGSLLLVDQSTASLVRVHAAHANSRGPTMLARRVTQVIRIAAITAIGSVVVQCLVAQVLDGQLRRAEARTLNAARSAREARELSTVDAAVALTNDRIAAEASRVKLAEDALREVPSPSAYAKSPLAAADFRTLAVKRMRQLSIAQGRFTEVTLPFYATLRQLETQRDSAIAAIRNALAFQPSALRRAMRLPMYLPWSILLSLILLPVPALPVAARRRRVLPQLNELLTAERRLLTLTAYRSMHRQYSSALQRVTPIFSPRSLPFADAPWNALRRRDAFVPIQQVLGAPNARARAGETPGSAGIIGWVFLVVHVKHDTAASSHGHTVFTVEQTLGAQAEVTYASAATVGAAESFVGVPRLTIPAIVRAHVTAGAHTETATCALANLRDVTVLDPKIVFTSVSRHGRAVAVTGRLGQSVVH